MKLGYIIVGVLKSDGSLHCWDYLFFTKEGALACLEESKHQPTAHLWDFKKTKIVRIQL